MINKRKVEADMSGQEGAVSYGHGTGLALRTYTVCRVLLTCLELHWSIHALPAVAQRRRNTPVSLLWVLVFLFDSVLLQANITKQL